MYYFVESERRYRNIETTSDQGNRDKETFFLDWVIPKEMSKGTDTIVVHALRAAKKLKVKLLYDSKTCNIFAEVNIACINDFQNIKWHGEADNEDFARNPKKRIDSK